MDAFTQFDGNLLIGIQKALYCEWLTPVMKVISYLAEDGILLIVVCLLMMLFRKTRRLGIICAFSLLCTFICCNLIIKPIVERPRPWTLFEAVNSMMPPLKDGSFPSGHTTNSMGVAWAMFINTLPVRKVIRNDETGTARTVRDYDKVPCLGWGGNGVDPQLMHRISIAAVVLAVLIGISRLYLGMHFPSDVICGLLLGVACAAIVQQIVKKVEQKHGIIGGKKV